METEKNNKNEQGQNENPEQVILDGVLEDAKNEVSELAFLKAELEKVKGEAQRNAERWVKSLQDIANYQDAITAMIKELGWDTETAIGKIGGFLGKNVFDVIEVNASSKFQR